MHKNVFPYELKKANVTPVFKKDNPLEALNYRPISVTNAYSKIFENFAFAVYDYLLKNDVMNPLQFGFRKGFSTHDALLYLTESIRYEIDKNKIVHCALLDLSKAFDSICHQKLLSKLSQTGFDNNAVKMIAHYLTNRYQRVNVNGVFFQLVQS